MNTNAESSSSSKFTPLPIAALMPSLIPLMRAAESPDSSYISVEDEENSFVDTKRKTSILKEHVKDPHNKQSESSKQKNELWSETFKTENKENTNSDNLFNTVTYPNKNSIKQVNVKECIDIPCPKSEIKKRSVHLPLNQIHSSTKREFINKYVIPERNEHGTIQKQTPDVVKNFSSNNQKIKTPTPKIKSGIRKFTPGSGHRNQCRTPLKLTTNQNKESMRCLFPDSKHKVELIGQSVLQKQEPVQPIIATPLNRKPLPSGYAATPSYPQGAVGNHSKISFKTTNIKGKNYMYIKKLGTGGSSEVYKVLEPGTSSEYAVKIVNLATDAELAQGYINEVRLLRELQDSDRVIRLFDFEYDKTRQMLRLVLEVGETDLSSMLRARGAGLSPALILYYWEEMLQAVNHIHEHGVIHADLKPANFLLVSGRLKLIDFGIASAMANDATSVVRAHATGTYSYISPEALLGGAGGYGPPSAHGNAPIKISLRSDVWSLGCILYRMVYGRTPFEHIPSLGKLAVILDPDHRIDYPPAEHLPAILVAALKWCLTYNARARPTVSQLLALPYLQPARGVLPAPLLPHLKPLLTQHEYSVLATINVT
ncbi:hypothetical protein EVAR_78735_1 [Eumeta japonica]|uniref:Protein kinase domain-containing protein n=1 Tax=Eumeta variegata TaxID=151549 RepID=A0A4C1T4Q6_EUMVA|nr:hypothetical protein EVAR_78735_1 [Eumeta japonica]